MTRILVFALNSLLLGVGLAMDAFSVSVANSLACPGMTRGAMVRTAGVFGVFQLAMPLIGWLCVRQIARAFAAFARMIPWIALVLLCYIGLKLILEGRRGVRTGAAVIGWGPLMLQGVATSIDALSVGFTIAEYPPAMAAAGAGIIGTVTFFICLGGLAIGRRFGMKLAGKASITGGVILIAIGLEIFLKGIMANG